MSFMNWPYALNKLKENIMSTPCQERGYEEGQVFETLESGSSHFDGGSIVVLDKDDGSSAPRFTLIKGGCRNGAGSYYFLFDVKRIYPPEEESKEVEVVCEGNKVKISRESAKALNLI